MINKNSKFFELLKHSSNYFIGNLAVGALAFLSLPIMTRILSPSDYGILSVFTGYQGVFVSIITLNCYVAMGRYYYEKKDDFRMFFGTNLIFVFLLLLIAFFSIFLFDEQVAQLLTLPLNTIIFIVPAILIYISGSWFEQIYIPQKESRKIAIRNVIRSLSMFVLSVVIILTMDDNKYLGQIYATMMIGSIFLIYYFVDMRKYLSFSFHWKHMKYILHYSVPLLPYALSGVVLAQFDRIMINHYVSSASAGLYTFAAVIGSVLTILSSALFKAWHPDYFQHMDEKNYKELKEDVDKILKIIVVFALLLIMFSSEIGRMLGAKDYLEALPVIPIIVIGYVFNSIFAFYGWNIEYTKKNIYLSITVLLAGTINIVLNIIFIPRFGYFAAAYTTAISYCTMAIFAWFTSKYILKIYYIPLAVILKPLAMLTATIVVYYFVIFTVLNFWILFIVKLLLSTMASAIICRSYISKLRTLLSK